ncbi:mucin-3A-like [Sitophilus oryzae]|uniref:Mucin-3A-like n=1 Tax=Sitophilus oryzae TaxID=7048 RepID=A0A6J2XCR8_SITOR|nr:mucin-3A-like [Sitophilus oryzae]
MCTWRFLVILLLNIISSLCIQNQNHRPSRHTNRRDFHIREGPSEFDWEHGLRESTIQALHREHFGDHNLRHLIYSAPLLGKRNRAIPFGDIAVLARGQLYANYAGYIFVQDPHENDCDDCWSSNRTPWHPRQNEQLVALWTVRRIRHRYLERDPKFEIEYTISPVNLRYHHENYINPNGGLNYNLPGHIFVLRSGDNHPNIDGHFNTDYQKDSVFIAQTPDGTKYILHSFPAYLTSESPRRHYSKTKSPASSTTSKQDSEDEKKIYETLLEILHKKTSPEVDRFTPTRKSSTTLATTTLHKTSSDRIIPLTELQTPFTTKSTTGYVEAHSPLTTIYTTPKKSSTTSQVVTSENYPVSVSHSYPTTEYHSSPKYETTRKSGTTTPLLTSQLISTTTSDLYPNYVTTSQKYELTPIKTEPISSRLTTQLYSSTKTQTTPNQQTTNYYRPATVQQTYTNSQTTSKQSTPYIVYTKPSTFSTYQPTPTTAYVTPAKTGIIPPKTTLHYFVAEEQQKTTLVSEKPSIATEQENEEYEEALFDIKGKPTYSTTPIKSTFITQIPTQGTTKSSEFTKEQPLTYLTRKTTTSYPSTEPTTKLYFKPETTYTTTKEYQRPSTFNIPITVYEPTETDVTLKDTKTSTIPYGTRFTETISTSFQKPLTNTDQPTTSLFNPTTTYSKIPIYTTKLSKIPTTEVETSVGLTTLMNIRQNKTTEMTYYTVEETEATKESTLTSPDNRNTPTQSEDSTPIRTTTPIKNVYELETTPKHIITTIQSDGRVSVQTTPIEETSTAKISTSKRKPTLTTEKSNFLIDTTSKNDFKIPLYKKPPKDYSEDDIFGSTRSTVEVFRPTISKKYTKSDVEEALFDIKNHRKSKTLKRRKSTTTESAPSKVVYSDFFEASTIPTATQIPPTMTTPNFILTTSAVYAKPSKTRFSVRRKTTTTEIPVVTLETLPTATERENSLLRKNDQIEPVTRQSYLTSISFEVNKRKKLFENQLKERNKGISSKTPSLKQLEQHKYIEDVTTIASTTKPFTNEVFDKLALRLVAEAKGIEYLENASTLSSAGETPTTTISSSTNSTTKKKKYTRRRSYVPRSKRPVRKKIVKTEIT